MTIATLGKSITNDILICAIEREGEVYIPGGNFQMAKDDIVSFVAPRRHIRSFLKKIGFKTKQVKDAMIVGGGKASYYLAKQLIAMGIDVKIIEQNKERCEELSILLPEAIIINGDGTDEEVLREEGIEYAQAFIPLTGIDEENIMLTLHAKQVSNAKLITKINRSTFKNVISKNGFGKCNISTLHYIRSDYCLCTCEKNSTNSNIETLYHMFDNRAEAIEFCVDEPSSVTSIPLKDLMLKNDLLVSFIYRNGKVQIPSGLDTIEVGDTVMIVTTHTGLDNIQDIIRS